MIDTTTAMIGTGLVVAGGQWARKKNVPVKVFVGTAAAAIFLSVLSSADEKLASQFAVLILVGAVLIYGIDIAEMLAGGYKTGMGDRPK